jgi:hypothetical protein
VRPADTPPRHGVSATWQNLPGILRASVVPMDTLVVMMALLVAAIVTMPGWPYSARWGYFPAGACGILALAMAALVLVGRL